MLEAKLYINGAWTETKSGSIAEDMNPADGSVVAKIHTAGPAEIEAALTSAQSALPAWRGMLASEREALLLKAAEVLQKNQDKYAGWLMDESGSCFMKAMDEVAQCVSIVREAAGQCRRVDGGIVPPDQPDQLSTYIRQPLGIIAGIAPFNYPLLLAISKVVLAMAAGNCFVLKPSSDTPLSGVILAEVMDEAGIPAGVFSLLPGSGSVVGDALIADPRVKMVTFTGSTAVGRAIARKCTEHMKKFTLEMGGKNPMLILKDFPVDRAVSIAAFGAYFHQGQICMATTRLIVEEPIYDEFCEKFTKKAAGIKVGEPHDPTAIIGPLIHAEQCDKIDTLIADAVEKGARLLTGGTHNGPYYQPTVVADVTPEMRIFYEECFGPVEIIVKAKDPKDGLRLCNDNEYGLSSALLTNDLALAMTLAPRIEAGMVHVNDTTVMGSRRAPFGGIKNSGMGREGSSFSIEDFTELKWITYQLAPGGYPTDIE